MTERYDACIGRKDKNGKTRWTKIGAAFPAKDGKDGFNIVLDALPMPNAEGQAWISLFVPKPKEEGQGDQRHAPAPSHGSASNADMDDNIPFSAEFR
jgi:hypothetical protein